MTSLSADPCAKRTLGHFLCGYPIVSCLFLFLICAGLVNCHVYELGSNLQDERMRSPWLVMFYAPWCGYCKQLEPIWVEVGQHLLQSDVKVGRIDATSYSALAQEFDVRGYPTIKFMDGVNIFTYKGGRTLDGIVEFATRAHGPPVQYIANDKTLQDVKKKHPVFFLYVGDSHMTDLRSDYNTVAAEMRLNAVFYRADTTLFSNEDWLGESSTIVVYKSDNYLPFVQPEDSDASLFESLKVWINNERFPHLVKIDNGNFHNVASLKKFIVSATLGTDEEKNQKLLNIVEDIALNNTGNNHYSTRFQFAFMENDDVYYQIAMSRENLPFVFCFDPETDYYYLPEKRDDDKIFELSDLLNFLDSVAEGTAPVYGGRSIHRRIYRMGFDSLNTVVSIWTEQPIVASVIFGVPFLVIFCLCYMICSTEPVGDDDVTNIDEDDSEYDEFEEQNYDKPPLDGVQQDKEPQSAKSSSFKSKDD